MGLHALANNCSCTEKAAASMELAPISGRLTK